MAPLRSRYRWSGSSGTIVQRSRANRANEFHHGRDGSNRDHPDTVNVRHTTTVTQPGVSSPSLTDILAGDRVQATGAPDGPAVVDATSVWCRWPGSPAPSSPYPGRPHHQLHHKRDRRGWHDDGHGGRRHHRPRRAWRHARPSPTSRRGPGSKSRVEDRTGIPGRHLGHPLLWVTQTVWSPHRAQSRPPPPASP